ncbi:GerMN domain-containing protein [Nocardioides sp. zg-1230]|uniref:GerMN domain-containing protein n=1 Tax=Nocardioides sp. zg-1230 TaxID=2736601 RepID=UPI0015519521|nr:GerMN domain-containing protein [Nocardioides sp. zg-1230]NPC42882.1 GerMN domain-containing protein [Nocardioides sp. zg-1230]
MRWLLALPLLLATTACGLPDEERSRTVDADVVPYNLLTTAEQEPEDTDTGPAHPRGEPVVFWLRRDGRLTTAPVGATCDDPVAQVVEDVLAALSASPTSADGAAGRTSAVPPSARLELVALEDGVAVVDLDPVALGDAERLPLAVGQLVLSVSSAPGVDGLRLVTSGESVDVPLPDGALADRPVTAADYVELLPPGLVAGAGAARTLADDVGCPT